MGAHIELYLFLASYCEIGNATKRLIKDESQIGHKMLLEHLNENFLKIGRLFPTVTYQWCSLLTVLNYKFEGFWSNIAQENIYS